MKRILKHTHTHTFCVFDTSLSFRMHSRMYYIDIINYTHINCKEQSYTWRTCIYIL